MPSSPLLHHTSLKPLYMIAFPHGTPASSSSLSASSSTRSTTAIDMTLRLPSRGSVFMPTPNPMTGHGHPRVDKELQGDLEIWVPPTMGPLRCKSISVGIKTVAKITIGGKLESDTLYEAKVEVRGGTSSSGVVLEPGVQRFAFNIIIPGNLAPHDFHPGQRVGNILFAELQGAEETGSVLGWFRRSSATSPRSSSIRSLSPSSPRSSSLTISRQESPLVPPSYDTSDPEDIPWLTGEHYTERPLVLIYNPNPSGGVTSLDSRGDAFAPGIGPVNVHYTSPEWTIAAALTTQLEFPSMSPATTIFYVQTFLVQSVKVTSLRDPTKVKTDETAFPICSLGNSRPSQRYPGLEVEAIWRGTDAGGTDQDSLVVQGKGFLPNDYKGRPSTLEGVETPVVVSHMLRARIFFSVQGEDAMGKPLSNGGPGELRVMQMQKKVVVPACFLIASALDLPVYAKKDMIPHRLGRDKRCALCGTPAADQFCKTCPLTSIPHPRHDHPPKLVGDPSGMCPLCYECALPLDREEFRDCACGLLCADLIERMKRVSMADQDLQEEAQARRGRRRDKALAERCFRSGC